jgi:branched-chain amino acid aminotransferase
MNAASVVWFNGALIPADQPLYAAPDRIRLGDGVFDTLLVVDGHALHCAPHYARLVEHAAILGIEVPLPQAGFQEAINSLIRTNKAQSGRYALNTIISRGEGARGLAPPDIQKPSVLLRLSAVSRLSSPGLLRGHIAQSVRRNEGSPLSRIKSFNYGDNILALKEASEHEANEAIMMNNAGHITCTSAGNIFMIKGGDIVTPPLSDGVLNGVARALFLKRYTVRERSVTPEDLLSSDTVFLTNSLRGACAFQSIGQKHFNALPLDIDPEFHILECS